MCVCVCVCVCEREREEQRKIERKLCFWRCACRQHRLLRAVLVVCTKYSTVAVPPPLFTLKKPYIHSNVHSVESCGVATISRLLKMVDFFCQRAI